MIAVAFWREIPWSKLTVWFAAFVTSSMLLTSDKIALESDSWAWLKNDLAEFYGTIRAVITNVEM